MADKPRPKEQLVRAIFPGLELRAAQGDGMPVMTGHFSVFNQWTTIRSAWEGTFMERIAPGAFKKTFNENRSRIRVLFQHGKDPQVGDKPLGQISELREDDQGAYYEVNMLDTAYNREILPGLEAGLYGASFRFSVNAEEVNDRPKRSDYNPEGLPERTIKEAKVAEFGPVTFGAYDGATAGVRSLSDRFMFEDLTQNPDLLRELIDSRQQSRTIVTRAPHAKVTFTSRGVVVDEKFDEERAPWDSSYISDLPDSAFLYIEPGGKKDDDGKTTPRSLRHFPYRDSSGSVDLPHLRNALARIPQSNLSPAVKAAATAKAQRLLANENKSNSAGQFGEERVDSEDLSILGQMLDLANCYLEEQDEPDDQKNVAPMEAIVKAIAALVPVEAAEDEPADEPDDEENSAVINAEERLEPDSSESTTPKPESEPSGATTRSGLILPRSTGPVTTKSGLILP